MQTLRARLVVSSLILASSISVFGQVKVSSGQAPLAGQARPGQVAHTQQEPCWKQVGISSATMDQQKSIQRESRAQIEAVCRDSALSDQEKKAKIQAIRQAEHEQLIGLIPAEQREQLKQCQQARASSHPATAPHASGVHSGPCGEIGGP
jgi:hypothetical protein